MGYQRRGGAVGGRRRHGAVASSSICVFSCHSGVTLTPIHWSLMRALMPSAVTLHSARTHMRVGDAGTNTLFLHSSAPSLCFRAHGLLHNPPFILLAHKHGPVHAAWTQSCKCSGCTSNMHSLSHPYAHMFVAAWTLSNALQTLSIRWL